MAQDLFTCGICQKKVDGNNIYFLENCCHMVCRKCIRNQMLSAIKNENLSNLKCIECGESYVQRDFQEILDQKDYQRYDDLSLKEFMVDKEMIECPSCKFQFLKSTVEDFLDTSQVEKYDGKVLSLKARKHRNKYRFRCQNCSSDFCSKCGATPYHIGYSCKEFKARSLSLKCRFCEEPIPVNTPNKFKDVEICDSEDCRKLFPYACNTKLSCGHFCCGIANEKQHLGCLENGCKNQLISNKKARMVDGTEYCMICGCSFLKNEPSVCLDCGHTFHYLCIKGKLEAGWTSERITFTYAKCPLCKTWISSPQITDLIKPVNDLLAKMKDKVKKRLEYEGMMNDKVLKEDFKGDWFEYAMKELSYFQCYKCKEPYFGGKKVCQGERQAEFKEEELICPSCSSGDNPQVCPTHGTEFIQWKCKFCCNMAIWFCWGNTHFCEECHKKSTTVPLIPRDKLPKCVGPPKCSGNHPPNGEEYCYGCLLCKKAENF
ncbi:e3 ubiquitin-protein ligase mycbp2 [Anaeramoeba ignava]|uniref:E3 ubiquitin-protein ligase mycbp2 n=1 Tax=Anaeramoeba ignava TaxID=1746090 RepID=A0A9Q0LBU6_ANAIG|nr:e3 ubiquitin-protein ligase mycbp2 [Anaeramoeba ignava]